MKKQKEYVEYMKEKKAFSSCEKIVGEMEKSEDRDQMRTYIIKTGMSRFRQQVNIERNHRDKV